MYKVGDLVVLIANRLNVNDSLQIPYKGNYSHLKGKILRIESVYYKGYTWDYALEGGISVKIDQIVPAKLAKTEIYKALTEEL